LDTGYCLMRGECSQHSPPDYPNVTSKPKGLYWEYQCAAANPAIALLLQSWRLAGRVAELGSLCRKQWPHVSSIRNMFKRIRRWFLRRRFREGRTLSRFIARDVRREILIVSTARIDQGIIWCRVRTTNVLYCSHGLIPQPEFEPPRELRIEEMWNWTGQSWGGLPDGTSIVDHLHGRQSD